MKIGHGVRIVLGLRNKIGGDRSWIAGFAGDDDLRGSGQHVDGAIKGDELLGGRNPCVAGTDDLVDAGQAFSPIGQRGDGMRSAHAVKLGDTQQERGGQGFLCRMRRDNGDALDAGNLRGDHGHEQRGRQRVAATGHVTADRGEGNHALAGCHSRRRLDVEILRALPRGKGANVASGGLQRLAHRFRRRFPRKLQFNLGKS